MMKEIIIKNNINRLSATIFGESSGSVLIIASATGVKQTFYKNFAKFMATKNKTVITFDYSGIGTSLHQKINTLNINAAQWGSIDLESVITYTLKNYPSSRITVLGHSIGGQIIGLAHSSTKVDKIILVASQSGYWKFWKGFKRIKMWLNWYILFPLLIKLFGYMPSKKFSGMENLPKNVAKQWSSWGRDKNYLLSTLELEDTVFNKINTNITSISIDDDNYAPKEAVNWMLNQYSKASKKEIHLIPEDYNLQKIGHFGLFKEKYKDSLWEVVLNELM